MTGSSTHPALYRLQHTFPGVGAFGSDNLTSRRPSDEHPHFTDGQTEALRGLSVPLWQGLESGLRTPGSKASALPTGPRVT